MNGKQAILKLKANLNKLDTASNRTVRPEYALLFLNDVYSKLVEAKYEQQGPQDSSGFQLNQKLSDELNYLTVPKVVIPSKVGDLYTVDIDSLENYLHMLRMELSIKVGTKTGVVKDPNITSLDTLGPGLDDPFNGSTPRNPVIYYEDNKIKIVAPNFEVTSVTTIYLRNPDPITLEGEIKCPFIDDVIDMTAVKILEIWEDQRATSLVSVNKLVEGE